MHMNAWLRRVKAWWHRIFFWQSKEEGSRQFKPDVGHDHALVLAVTKKNLFPGLSQLRFLFRVLNKQERGMLVAAGLVGVFSILVGIGAFIQPHLHAIPGEGGILTEALVGSPKLLNPLYAPQNDVDRDLVALIYSGLFRIDADLNPQPDLATSYHWLEDDRTLEVRLRKDIRFHDGLQVTANDVVFTYQAAKDPSWRSALGNAFRDITVIRVDDQTVQFQLPTKNSAFLYDLTLGILPAHAWEDVRNTNAYLADVNLKPIGSGPYRVSSFTRDTRGQILKYHLRVNPDYYGMKPHIHEWVFRFYPDREQALYALQTNQVDSLAFVPWGEASQVKNENVQRISLELPQETVAFFNTNDVLLKDEGVRKALALAVDPAELEQLANGHATLIDGPFPFLQHELSTSSRGNLTASRDALTALGWTLREGESVRSYQAPQGTSNKKSRTQPRADSTVTTTKLHLTISVPDQTDLLKVADFLKRRWSLIGVRVDIRTDDSETLLRQAVDQRDYQLLIWNILLSPNQDISLFWSSEYATGRGLNLANLTDRDVDKALLEVKRATSTDALLRGRVQVAKAVTNHAPALFLLRPAYAYLLNKHVRGIRPMHISTPSDRLLQSADWYIKTEWTWK